MVVHALVGIEHDDSLVAICLESLDFYLEVREELTSRIRRSLWLLGAKEVPLLHEGGSAACLAGILVAYSVRRKNGQFTLMAPSNQ